MDMVSELGALHWLLAAALRVAYGAHAVLSNELGGSRLGHGWLYARPPS